MIEIGPARESEIVLTFLKAELEYLIPQHVQPVEYVLHALRMDKAELLNGALDSDYYNAARAVVLDAYRGYLTRTMLFVDFPRDVEWRHVVLEPADFARLRYVRAGEWMPVSENTRDPRRVADRIAAGEQLERDIAPKIAAIRDRLTGGEELPPLMAVEGHDGTLVLIDGAHRTTAYVGLNWNENLPAFIGRSPAMSHWAFY